jgi:hypothetical protein
MRLGGRGRLVSSGGSGRRVGRSIHASEAHPYTGPEVFEYFCPATPVTRV